LPPEDELDLKEIERALRARQDDLRAQIARLALPPERGTGLQFGKRIGDGTAEAVSRLTDVGVGGNLELREARVSRALEKLEQGRYGDCEGCGKPIPVARLRAAPESVQCIECARKARLV